MTNGSAEREPIASATYIPGAGDGMDDGIGVEKRNSLGRSAPAAGARFVGRRPMGIARMSQDQGKRDSAGSIEGRHEGVTLTDKPMDD